MDKKCFKKISFLPLAVAKKSAYSVTLKIFQNHSGLFLYSQKQVDPDFMNNPVLFQDYSQITQMDS